MKTKRPYKPRAPRRTPDQELLKDCHDAMRDAIEAWDVPDSPEGFCYCMKHLMILRDRIAARIGISSANTQAQPRQ
jgi:hypothetical protein